MARKGEGARAQLTRRVAQIRPPVATCLVRAASTMGRYGRGLGATDSRWVARGGDLEGVG